MLVCWKVSFIQSVFYQGFHTSQQAPKYTHTHTHTHLADVLSAASNESTVNTTINFNLVNDLLLLKERGGKGGGER